jgi:hypothetical protein
VTSTAPGRSDQTPTRPRLAGTENLELAHHSSSLIARPSVAWCRHAGVTSTEATDGTAPNSPAPEERSFVHVATQLRSALIDIGSALAARHEPDAAAITELQARYVEAIGHAEGSAGPHPGNALTWSWAHRPPAERALWKLTDTAVELFRHGTLERP